MLMVSLDLETTGLPDDDTEDPNLQPGIIEIGMVKYQFDGDRFERLDEFAEYVKPERPIPDIIWKITNIDPANIESAKTFPAIFPRIAKFAHGAELLVTFNGAFDCRILMYNLRRYNLQYRFPWPPEELDVMLVSKDFVNIQGKASRKFPKLVELHQHLFDKPYEAHRALNDAEATMNCLMMLHKQHMIL